MDHHLLEKVLPFGLRIIHAANLVHPGAVIARLPSQLFGVLTGQDSML